MRTANLMLVGETIPDFLLLKVIRMTRARTTIKAILAIAFLDGQPVNRINNLVELNGNIIQIDTLKFYVFHIISVFLRLTPGVQSLVSWPYPTRL